MNQSTDSANENTSELLHCATYSRYSPKPKGKVDPDTVESQEEAMDRYCRYAGLSVSVRLRDPLVSARHVPLYERPDGAKIPHLIALGIKHIVAVRLDRLWRDSTDGILCLNEWTKAGVSIHLSNQGGQSLNAATATGRFIIRTLLSVAELEPDLTAERTSMSMRSYQAAGRRMTAAGKLPWGWMIDPNDSAKMIPNLVERHDTTIIQQLLDANQTLTGIANGLNERGRLCRDKPWDHRNVRRAAEAKWED